MLKNPFFLFAIVAILFQMACSGPPPTPKDLSEEALIPWPVSLTATGSSFAITAETGINISDEDEEAREIAEFLAAKLRSATGFPLAVKASNATSGNIQMSLSADEELGNEGYELVITEDGIKLSAAAHRGLFYGVQTIRQLLPASIESGSKQTGPWEIASGTIRDYPEYGYRGAMLDVARHFFEVDEVKRYIDYLALYKMNALHLHLSDDQGWRIEIKSWPKLTEVGGSSEVGGGKGGFFTQDQYTDIVNYAADHYITVVPEIDMPGHTNAALASYPELYCPGKGKKPEIYTGIEVGFSTLCNDNAQTFKFVDDVIRELAAITPGPYIHIGGDESHATPMKEYIPFVNQVQDIVEKHGKLVMGWDEIANASLKKSTVVQYWAEAENATKGIAQGAKVLMSPAHKTYLDMQYDSTSKFGLHWAAYIEVDSAYIWDPTKMTAEITREDIFGIETPLWSETVSDLNEAEYLVFPRLPGHAEIGWSPYEVRDWETYKVRLGKQKARFEALGIDYYPSKLVPWQ